MATAGLLMAGSVLASLPLPLTPENGAAAPTGAYSPFVPIGVTLNGTARSVAFGGSVNDIGFDNITFGSATPGPPTSVPDGGCSALLLGLGALGLAGLHRRR